jgi:hypothetical protein
VMSSLNAHLSTASRRLRRIASRRTRAAALSVALAVTSTVPAGAVAQEPDQEREGSAPPEQLTGPESIADPDFDPGGDDTQLEIDVGPAADGGEHDSGDGEPVETDPAYDPDAPTPPPADEQPSPDALSPGDETSPPPAAPTPTPTPPRAPTPVPSPTPETDPPPAAPTPTADDHESSAHHDRPARLKPRPNRRPLESNGNGRARARRHTIEPSAPEPVAATPPPTASVPVAATPTATASTATAPDASGTARPARQGDRAHIVQRGESLWMIASDLLGPNASDAQLVAESNRLYQLNRERIGPDPNLIVRGTVLRLR